MDISNGIPKKITPDCLVDTIVEFSIESDYKDEVIERTVLKNLKDSYPDSEFRKYEITESEEEKHFYANDDFRIYICNSFISINIVSGYPGWKIMDAFIKDALKGLNDVESPILKFRQVRMNYVSRFPNVSIFDVWDGARIELNNIPPFLGREFSFKFSILEGQPQHLLANARVHLTDQVPSLDGKGTYSRIDIGLEAVKSDGAWNSVYKQLQMLHENENQFFFRLLSKEFVDKLNPKW